ncbi:MAG: carboxypeptidase regulatory-like domain-containing protein [Gemmatimonadota bacterium]|nr:carboxypeptidase regulatory-like domain-containing protein [Gemmatimonadota bacterium]
MRKIRLPGPFGLIPLLAVVTQLPAPLVAQGGASVSGKVTLMEKGEQPSSEVVQAVVWLTGANATLAPPSSSEMATEGKQFVPHIRIVQRGSSISYPNHDPFNHNVFSLSAERVFDLGLYGRGEAKAVEFGTEGVVRVYCNVHAQMRGLVLVLGSNLFTQPGSDGRFRIEGVAPGEYVLHAWHERAPMTSQPLKVGDGAVTRVAVALDARGFRIVQHKDKEGKSYSDRIRRY